MAQSSDGGETWENITGRPDLPKRHPGQDRRGRLTGAARPRLGADRARDRGRPLPLRRLRRHVGEGQRQPEPALARLVLHAPHRRPAGSPIRSTSTTSSFWKSTDGGKTFAEIATPHGDNHDLWIDPHDNRRMIQGNDGGANVSLNGGVYLVDDLQPADRAVLSSRHRQPRALPRLRHPAGQHQHRRAQPQPITAPSPGAIASSPARGESGYIAVRPDDPDIVYVGAIGSSPGGGNCLQRYDRRTGPDPPDHDLARGRCAATAPASTSTASPGPTRS